MLTSMIHGMLGRNLLSIYKKRVNIVFFIYAYLILKIKKLNKTRKLLESIITKFELDLTCYSRNLTKNLA